MVQCAIQQGSNEVSRLVWLSVLINEDSGFVQYNRVLMESAGLYGSVCGTTGLKSASLFGTLCIN